MRTITLFIIVSLVNVIDLRSQVCNGNFVFQTQAYMDQFGLQNANCTTIQGNVEIWFNGDLSNLNGLSNITTINGNLKISVINGATSELSGLLNLTTVTLTLELNSVTGFAGLNNLHTCGGLRIITCPANDYSVFDNIHTIHNILNPVGGLYIQNSLHVTAENLFPSLVGILVQIRLDLAEPLDVLSGFHGVTQSRIRIDKALGTVGYITVGEFNCFSGLVSSSGIELSNLIIGSGTAFDSLQSAGNIQQGVLSEALLWDFPSVSYCTSISLSGCGPATPSFPLITSVESYVVGGAYTTVHLNTLVYTLGNLFIHNIPNTIFPQFSITQLEFESLDDVYGWFQISGTDITELNFPSMFYAPNHVTISNNQFLSDCAVTWLCHSFEETWPINLVLENNGGGTCNDLPSLISACSSIEGYVSGYVYIDTNCNNLKDEEELTTNLFTLINGQNQPVGTMYSQGLFLYQLPYDGFSDSISVMPPTGYTAGSHIFSNATNNMNYPGINLGLCPTTNAPNLGVSLAYASAPPRPGFNYTIPIRVTNYMPSTVPCMLEVNLSSLPGAQLIQYSDGGVLVDGVITWNIEPLSLLESHVFLIEFYIPTTVALGTGYSALIEVVPLTEQPDIDEGNNVLVLNSIVVGSYDPNDKQVSRTHVNVEEIQQGDGVWLEYIVRFQNTGNAEAITVRVEDIINHQLNLSTFQFLTASHECSVKFLPDRKIEWLFENIMIPDSTTNEPESHGYLVFRIKTMSETYLELEIPNQVAIYFDFNDPIITNIATTTFYSCHELQLNQTGNILSVNYFEPIQWSFIGEVLNTNQNTLEITDDGIYQATAIRPFCESNAVSGFYQIISVLEIEKDAIIVYPNPAKDLLYVNVPSSARTNDLIFIDAMGREAKRVSLYNESETISVEDLHAGIYLLRCGEDSIRIMIQ